MEAIPRMTGSGAGWIQSRRGGASRRAPYGMRRIPYAVRENGAKMAAEPRSGTESAQDRGAPVRSICATWGFGEAWRRKGPAGPRSVPERGSVAIFGACACMKGRGSSFEGKKVVRRSSLVRVRKGEEPLLGLEGAIGRWDRTFEGLPCRLTGRLPLLPAQGAADARRCTRQNACRALAGGESSQVCRGRPLFRMRAVRGARPDAAGRARVLY